MKKLNAYKIFKTETWNEYGKLEYTNFFIKEHVSFLGITYWKKIKHTNCGYGDCCEILTTFTSESDAETFIKEKLCGKIYHIKQKDSEIKEVTCK